jgi:hypothetical protein
MLPRVRTKIALGVAVAVAVSCCGFALWRRFAPNHHAFGDKGCYASTVDVDQLDVASCEKPHDAEIVDFYYAAGADAGCHRAAEDFLGGPLADARVALQQLRYVRDDFTSLACALVEASDSDGTPTARAGTLRGTMAGPRPMAIGCGRFDAGRLVYGDCTRPHAAEYTASVVDGGDHRESCRQAAAAYLGLTPDGLTRRGDLTPAWLDRPRDGGRVGCLVLTADGRETLTASVRGLRTAPLPAS